MVKTDIDLGEEQIEESKSGDPEIENNLAESNITENKDDEGEVVPKQRYKKRDPYSEKNIKVYRCEERSLVFTKNTAYRRHIKAVHFEGKLICDLCDRTFSGKTNLIRHMKLLHIRDTKEYTCCECGHICIGSARYHRHRASHSKVPCSICGVTVRTTSLKSHMKTHDENRKLYECKICNMTFKRNETFQLHQFGHAGKKFECDICNKTFAGPRHLIIHKKAVHQGIHQCPSCEQKFLTEKRLKSHVRKLHEELDFTRPLEDFKYTCNECGLRFKLSKYLTTHKKVHERQRKEMKLVCVYCGKKCRSETELAAHRLTHTGQNLDEDSVTQQEIEIIELQEDVNEENFDDLIEVIKEEEPEIVRKVVPRPNFKKPTVIIRKM